MSEPWEWDACDIADRIRAGDLTAREVLVRTEAAQTLAAWLASDPTGSNDPDFLIIGDLNAYDVDGQQKTIHLLHEYLYGRT